MKILKGQEILPDDSTLVQHNISDGNTVNILIEPENNIVIEVQCRPKTFVHNVSHCMTIKQLKMLLIESKEVGFFYRHFSLVIPATNTGITEMNTLDDDSLPIHYYACNGNIKLEAVNPVVLLKSQNPLGEISYHKITNKSSVNDLKAMIMTSRTSKDVTSITMFVSDGNDGYIRLDELDDLHVCKLLPEDKTVYFIEDRLSFNRCWPVYHQDKEVGQVYGNDHGSSYDRILSAKLRIQEEMGIPTICITIYHTSEVLSNHIINHKTPTMWAAIEPTEMRPKVYISMSNRNTLWLKTVKSLQTNLFLYVYCKYCKG